jgi:hypothetical protein
MAVGGLARARVDGRPPRDVAHARHVVRVEVGHQHASERLALRPQPTSEVLAHHERLDVHDVRHDARQDRVLAVVRERPLDAGVDDEQPAGRVLDRVEVDLDGLGPVDEARQLRLRVVEVEQSRQGHLPVGAR